MRYIYSVYGRFNPDFTQGNRGHFLNAPQKPSEGNTDAA